jgi:hypothetical protein
MVCCSDEATTKSTSDTTMFNSGTNGEIKHLLTVPETGRLLW